MSDKPSKKSLGKRIETAEQRKKEEEGKQRLEKWAQDVRRSILDGPIEYNKLFKASRKGLDDKENYEATNTVAPVPADAVSAGRKLNPRAVPFVSALTTNNGGTTRGSLHTIR